MGVAWYKSQQVHPVISRLLSPVEGTDAARIAECLGMDASRFAGRVSGPKDEMDVGDSAYAEAISADIAALMDRSARFRSFETSLVGLECQCGARTQWKQLLQPGLSQTNGPNALFRCGSCGIAVHPKRMQNLFVIQLRSLLREYCMGWTKCDDDVAPTSRTRRVRIGQPFRNAVDERKVLQDLEFLAHLCETARTDYVGEDSRGCFAAATGMEQICKRQLTCNGYNWVDCGKLFGAVFGSSGK